MTKLMEEEFISIWMVPSTMVIGEKTSNMDMEWKHGPMEPNMKGTMNMGRNMELVHSNGLITLNTLESSITTIFMGKESTLGVMGEDTKVNGKTIRCMEKGLSLGQMEGNMWESTLMIRNKVMVNSFGLMADLTRETGTMGSSMAKVFM